MDREGKNTSESGARITYEALISDAAQGQANWYAIRTRSRHEKLVDKQLKEMGITSFLPLVQQTRRWSDRRKRVDFPLFPGYSFVQVAPRPEQRIQVLRVNGVVGFVGTVGQGTPIPEVQIESIRTIIAANIPFASHPFLKVGLLFPTTCRKL